MIRLAELASWKKHQQNTEPQNNDPGSVRLGQRIDKRASKLACFNGRVMYMKFWVLSSSMHSLETYQTPAVTARYPALDAFFMASTASAVDSRGVVLTDLHAPPAAKAMAIAPASTLLGI